MTTDQNRPRPSYLEGAQRLDDITRMVLELTSELWILKDRTLVLEHLLASRNLLAQDEIAAFQPTAELAAQLRREREAMVARVLGALLPASERTAAALAR